MAFYILVFSSILLLADVFKLQLWFYSINPLIEPASTLALFTLISLAICKDINGLIKIIIFTMFVEILGVFTGFPFGAYNYNPIHSAFGIFGVPLFIAFAWYIIIYSFANMTKNPLLTALFSVSVDIAIEEYAVIKGLWFWEGSGILIAPLQNYFAWFAVGYIGYYLVKQTNYTRLSYIAITIILINISMVLLLAGNIFYGLFGLALIAIYTFLYQKSSFSFLLPILKPKQANKS